MRIRSSSTFSNAHMAVIALVFATIGGLALHLGVAAGQKTVWVSPAGNDTNCAVGNQGLPCASLNKAFSLANCGDIVEVASGSYPSQSISSAKTCTSSTPVKFEPAAGAQPSFASVSIHTSYVWIEGMKVPHSLTGTTVGSWSLSPAAGQYPSSVSYITLKNDEGGALYIVAEHVDVSGGTYGGFSACLTGQEDLTRIWQQSGPDGQYHASSYVTIEGVTVHDGTDNGNKCGDAVNGPHVDAMQILGGHYITIRNSFFYNCPTSCIIGSGFRTGEDNYLIENNFFQKEAHPGATLNFSYNAAGDPPTGVNMVIRYNTTNGTISTGCVSGSPGCWDVYGNIAGSGYCPGGTWEYNVVANGSCTGQGAGNKTGTPAFAGPTPQSSYGSATIPNFHLASSKTIAAGAGDPTRYPSTDYDGDSRPQGTPPDAGADQYTIAAPAAAQPPASGSPSPAGSPSSGSSKPGSSAPSSSQPAANPAPATGSSAPSGTPSTPSSKGTDTSSAQPAGRVGVLTSASAKKKAFTGAAAFIATASIAIGAAYCIRLYHQKHL